MSSQSLRTFDGVRENNQAARPDHVDDDLLEAARTRPNLSGLTDDEKRVWLSCEQGGLRPAELAESTHWTPSTIRTILSRSRRKLNNE